MVFKTDTYSFIDEFFITIYRTHELYCILYLFDRSNIPNKCFCFVSGTYSIAHLTIQKSKCTRKILKTCEYKKNLIKLKYQTLNLK